jgi:hypothetical protein
MVGHHRFVFFGDRIVIASTDQPLDGIYGVFRVRDALALGRLPDQDFAIVGEGDHGRRRTAALGIFDDLGLVPFHHGNAGVSGSEIDTNCLRHDQAPCFQMRVDRLLSGAHRHVGGMNRASLRTFFDRMRDAQSASGGETANASRDRSEDLKRLP